jgi:hypothetical protein
MSPESAEWIDGPRLVAWCEGLAVIDLEDLKTQIGSRWETRVRAWRDGGAAHVYTVDEFLCSRGVCLGEMPDEFWRDPPSRSAQAVEIPKEKSERILRLFKLGWNYADIGRIVGCDKKTARSHVRKAEATR